MRIIIVISAWQTVHPTSMWHTHSTRFTEPRMSTRHQCEESTLRHKAHFTAVFRGWCSCCRCRFTTVYTVGHKSKPFCQWLCQMLIKLGNISQTSRLSYVRVFLYWFAYVWTRMHAFIHKVVCVLGRLKPRDLTSRDHQNCGDWHRETGQRGTISQGWTSRNLFQFE